mgnify:CR=1 FL=1
MIEYVMWAISFVTLYIALIWLNFLYLGGIDSKQKRSNFKPTVDIVIPAYNEQDHILQTLKSVLNLDYPPPKLHVFVVNDGSTDETSSVVRKFIKNHKLNSRVTLIDKKRQGKAAALNTALSMSKAELFGCVDADSIVSRSSLKHMIHHFADAKTGAVISDIKIYNPQNLIERMQRVEYMLAVLMRKIRASIETLAMTPGVLSIYRTSVLRDVGGFDEQNITEDFEIALRLKSHGYNVELESESFTYTRAPRTLKQLWNQRIRWFRGYIHNHYKYKHMFFNKKYGLMAYFQLPLNILGIPLLILTIGIVSYGAITHLTEIIVRSILIKNYFSSLFYIPNPKDLVLGHNIKIMFPIYIAFVSGIYMLYVAHKQTKERFKYPLSLWAYFAILPYLSCVYWISAIIQEVTKMKKKW